MEVSPSVYYNIPFYIRLIVKLLLRNVYHYSLWPAFREEF